MSGASPWGQLPPEFHGVDTINVFGGGPSIKPYAQKLRSLLDGVTIGACRAGLLLDCDITIGCDGRFPKQCEDEIEAYLDKGGRYLVHPIRPHVKPAQTEHLDPRFILIGWKRGGVSKVPDHVHGLDSGFACVNAALIYRPRRIRLFGLDYTAPSDDDARFHDGYRNTKIKAYDRSLWSWVQQYQNLRQEIAAFDVEITNYVGVPESRIETFPKKPIEEAFHD